MATLNPSIFDEVWENRVKHDVHDDVAKRNEQKYQDRSERQARKEGHRSSRCGGERSGDDAVRRRGAAAWERKDPQDPGKFVRRIERASNDFSLPVCEGGGELFRPGV